MCGHRECYYQVLKDHSDVDLQSDDYTLGLHLAAEHGCVDSNDLKKNTTMFKVIDVNFDIHNNIKQGILYYQSFYFILPGAINSFQ